MLKQANIPWAMKVNLSFLAMDALRPREVEGADGDEGAALEDDAPEAKVDE